MASALHTAHSALQWAQWCTVKFRTESQLGTAQPGPGRFRVATCQATARTMSKAPAQLDLTAFSICLTPIKGFHYPEHRIYTVRTETGLGRLPRLLEFKS